MTKGQIYRNLKQKFKIKKVRFKPYDWEVVSNNTTYQVKVLPVTQSTQLTINSKYIWNIQRGKKRGIRFIVKSNQLLQMKDLLTQENPVVICSNKPYKVLQYINESEVVDISDASEIYEVPFNVSLSKLEKFLNK